MSAPEKCEDAQRPSGSGRVVQLDFARGLAILSVIQVHVYTVPVHNFLLRNFEIGFQFFGGLGVDLFFVLSGFLIGGLLVQELMATGGLRIRRFWLRRLLKIWPAYYAYLLFQICVRQHPLHSFLWQNVFNVQNYTGTSLQHTWSLAVEEHFYLVLPMLLAVIYRFRKAWTPHLLAAICFVVLLVRVVEVFLFHGGDVKQFTHTRLDSLLFGVLLGYLLYEHRDRFERLLSARIPLALIALCGPVFDLVFPFTGLAMNTFGYTVDYLSMAALLLLVYGYRGRLTLSWPYRAVAWIGTYSYGIYLWHVSVRGPLLALSRHLPGSIQWGVLIVSQYAAGIVLGVLMTRAIELPMLRVRERLIPRGPAHLPPPVA
jgi:peptidoglycan/LPS O-acetylase OafA/YrhL